MTTLQEALAEFGTGALQAFAEAAMSERERAAKDGNAVWAASSNALLCAAVDEQAARRKAEAELFERLGTDPRVLRGVQIVGVELPGRDD